MAQQEHTALKVAGSTVAGTTAGAVTAGVLANNWTNQQSIKGMVDGTGVMISGAAESVKQGFTNVANRISEKAPEATEAVSSEAAETAKATFGDKAKNVADWAAQKGEGVTGYVKEGLQTTKENFGNLSGRDQALIVGAAALTTAIVSSVAFNKMSQSEQQEQQAKPDPKTVLADKTMQLEGRIADLEKGMVIQNG